MRYNQKYCVREPEKAVYIKDRRGQENHSSTYYCMKKSEYALVRPNESPMRLDFIFRKGSALKVDMDIANYLTEHYKHFYVVDPETGSELQQNDDLDKKGYHQLVQILKAYNNEAEKQGMPKRPSLSKMIYMRNWIRHFRRLGIRPDFGASTQSDDETKGDEDDE